MASDSPSRQSVVEAALDWASTSRLGPYQASSPASCQAFLALLPPFPQDEGEGRRPPCLPQVHLDILHLVHHLEVASQDSGLDQKVREERKTLTPSPVLRNFGLSLSQDLTSKAH